MRIIAASFLLTLGIAGLVSRPAEAVVCANCAQEITQLLNHAELVVSAAKAIEEVEIAIRNIQNLGQNFGGDIFQAMNVVRAAMGTVQRVTYQVGQAEEAFLSRYQQAFGLAALPEGMFSQSMSQVYLDSRDDMSAALQESVRVRSMAAEAMQLQAAADVAAGAASQAAPGILYAQQAGNALVQNTNARLANMQATMISYHETQVRAQRDGVLEGMVADVAHARNMACFGEGKSSIIVDPYGLAASIRSTP
jgi:P-type conjugative transfer protein TrbJ